MEIEEGLLCKADVQWNTTYTSKKYRILKWEIMKQIFSEIGIISAA